MELFTYGVMFLIGIFFGSFFTLAVYRIPRGENILYKHSYCPNCNHKLQFLDLFPIFSYLFLKGKCRYCKEKVRIRYLLLELLSGIVFVLFAMSIKLNFFTINSNIMYIKVGIQILFLSGLFIIAGIDKEKKQIQKSVLWYEIIIALIYMIYVCTFTGTNVYKYVIYLGILLIALLTSTYLLHKNAKNYYILDFIILLICILFISDFVITYYTLNLGLLLICSYLLYKKINNGHHKFIQEDNTKKIKMPIAFIIVISNIICTIIINFITNY